jgi:hypothetical protein
MIPEGIGVTVDDIPPKWGLLEVRKRHVRKLRDSGGFPARAYVNEIAFLVSIARRAEIRAVDAWEQTNAGKPRPIDFLNQWTKFKVKLAGSGDAWGGEA